MVDCSLCIHVGQGEQGIMSDWQQTFCKKKMKVTLVRLWNKCDLCILEHIH